MGKPSDKRHSAQRPGRRERERVKSNRPIAWTRGAGGETVRVKLGRKKAFRHLRWQVSQATPIPSSSGNLLNPKAGQKSK